MGALFANNAVGPLAASVAANGTTLTLSSGYGARFPAPDNSKGEYFYATLINPSNQMEIVKCTQRINDSLVVERAQEGTTARIYDVNDRLEQRITAAGMASKLDKDGGSISGPVTFSGNVTLGDSSTDIVTIKAGHLTLSTPLIVSGSPIDFQNTVTVGGVALVTTTSIDTLRNKTIDTAQGNVIKINGNTLAAAAGVLTYTFPNASDVLVGRATVDTLTNKTIVGLAAASTILNGAGAQVAIGYRDIPQNPQSGGYALQASDAGGYVYSRNSGAQTITVPSNVSTPIPLDAAITIINHGSNDISIVSGGPTLLHANLDTNGTKVLPPQGAVTLLHVESDVWFII